jgi:hypothetical protein
LVTEMQVLLHTVLPAAQVTQAPSRHTPFAPHTVPHPPQLLGSDWGFTQTPLQRS